MDGGQDSCETWSDGLAPLLHEGVSDRKRRLFAVACLRRRLDLLDDPRSRQALIQAQRYAEGLITEQERLLVDHDAFQAFQEMRDARLGESLLAWSWQQEQLRRAASLLVTPGLYYAEDVADHARRAVGGGDEGWLREQQELQVQYALLAEILGPRPLPHIDPLWLTQDDSAVLQLARSIHLRGEQELYPLLADALEFAGCNSEAMLTHCRVGGVHLPGCWVVDLLLGLD
ncbi:MAG: hypothetical protein U0840_22900 [Gemmataceae bacterium]